MANAYARMGESIRLTSAAGSVVGFGWLSGLHRTMRFT